MYLRELGRGSIERLPMALNMINSEVDKRKWEADSRLAVKILKYGELVYDEPAIPIGDHSYHGLDALNLIKKKDKDKGRSLQDIGLVVHDAVVSQVLKENATPNDLAQNMLTLSFIFWALCALLKFFRH